MNNPIITNIILFAAFLAFMATGFPIAFCMFGIGFVGLLFYIGWGGTYTILHLSVIDTTNYWILYTIPVFIFMGSLIEKTGIAEGLYKSFRLWTQSLPGGLAVATLLMGIVIAAINGEPADSVVTQAFVSLDPMIKYKYDRKLTFGCILAAGSLDILIPPSILMVVYVNSAEISLGRLFIGGYLPGVLVGLIYIAYVLAVCIIKPSLGPVVPMEDRVGWKEKIVSLKFLFFPVFLVVGILYSIFIGFLAPSEAASVGCGIVILWTLFTRQLKWHDFLAAMYITIKLTCMIMWIIIASRVFTSLYFFTGAGHLGDYIVTIITSKWGGLITLEAILFILGLFLDPVVIVVLMIPIVRPLVLNYGFDQIWFGELFCMNMMIGLLTPPVGLNIFYLKPVSPEGTTLSELYLAAAPFAVLSAIALVIVIIFPQIALWLPNHMLGS